MDLVLEPGRVYRTAELPTNNKSRLAKRLVAEGKLKPLEVKGLFMAPKKTRFGDAPPTRRELAARFLKDDEFVFTGPEQWNALGLGTTAVFARQLVYNRKRTGVKNLAGQPFQFRRVPFPSPPTPEWYAVDLLEHAASAGTSEQALIPALASALRSGKLSRETLYLTAKEYGKKRTEKAVLDAMAIAA